LSRTASVSDRRFLAQAVATARRGIDRGEGGPFGAVVVKAGRVIGRGHNRVILGNDPTAHAEMVAIRDACRRLKGFDLRGAALYSTCEPCPMCFGAILWARLDRLVFGSSRHDAAAAGFDDGAFWRAVQRFPRRPPIVVKSVLHSDSRALYRRWHDKPDRVPY